MQQFLLISPLNSWDTGQVTNNGKNVLAVADSFDQPLK